MKKIMRKAMQAQERDHDCFLDAGDEILYVLYDYEGALFDENHIYERDLPKYTHKSPKHRPAQLYLYKAGFPPDLHVPGDRSCHHPIPTPAIARKARELRTIPRRCKDRRAILKLIAASLARILCHEPNRYDHPISRFPSSSLRPTATLFCRSALKRLAARLAISETAIAQPTTSL